MIGALILGLFAGFIGRALLPGKQNLSLLMTIVLGLAGAALGWLFFTELLGIGDDDAFDLGSLPGAIVGAVVLLWTYERFVAAPRPAASPPARSRADRERGAAERHREREAGELRGGGEGRRGRRGGEGRGRRREP